MYTRARDESLDLRMVSIGDMQISRGAVLSLLKETRLPSPDTAVVRRAGDVVINAADRNALLRWIRSATTRHRVVIRATVVLLAGAGWRNARIAAHLGISRRTVALWKSRFRAGGAKSVLADAPGRGRKRGRDQEVVSRILAATRQSPPNGSRWTVRTLALTVGVSHATVQRVWHEHGVRPTSSRV